MTAGQWHIEISDEVRDWYLTLSTTGRAYADAAIDRLCREGPMLRMPYSRSLGGGLLELRFTCENSARRITYFIDADRKIITLTTFRKQRQREEREVSRARRAMTARKRRT